MRVALVDDHKLFRRGLRGLLERDQSIEIVTEASSGEEFLATLVSTPIDLVFMDISMEGISGDQTTERALEICPDLKIISLTMFGEEIYYRRMKEAGAKGFLLKDSDIQEVLHAIELVSAGGEYFSERALGRSTTTSEFTPESVDDGSILSQREIEILICVCQGLSNIEIADQLFISKRTVDKHRANIMEKTGCKNTASLVIYAIKHSLVRF